MVVMAFFGQKKTMPRSLRIGKEAKVSILINYLHPSRLVRDKYPNPLPGQRLEGCTVVGQGSRRISGGHQEAYVVRHPDFGDNDLYATKRWFKVIEEGPDEFIFGAEGNPPLGEAEG